MDVRKGFGNCELRGEFYYSCTIEDRVVDRDGSQGVAI